MQRIYKRNRSTSGACQQCGSEKPSTQGRFTFSADTVFVAEIEQARLILRLCGPCLVEFIEAAHDVLSVLRLDLEFKSPQKECERRPHSRLD